MPVGADEVGEPARSCGRRARDRRTRDGHAVAVLVERRELGREADLATERPEVLDEDRLEVVLGR